MGSLVNQRGRNRVKCAARQIVEENEPDAAIDALRELMGDLSRKAHTADLSESFEKMTDAIDDPEKAVDVARAVVSELSHSTHEGAALTRVAVDHAPDPEAITPEPPNDVLAEAA